MLKDRLVIIFAFFTVVMLVAAYFVYGFGNELAAFAIAAVFMAVFSVEDIRSHTISNRLLLIMLALSVITIGLSFDTARYIGALTGAVGIFVIMLIMYLVSMKSLGFGDVKLFTVMGLLIGFVDTIQLIFMTLLLTVVAGGAYALIGKKGLKLELPMVPFGFFALLLNTYLTLFAS